MRSRNVYIPGLGDIRGIKNIRASQIRAIYMGNLRYQRDTVLCMVASGSVVM
jgi:hypothetical protein